MLAALAAMLFLAAPANDPELVRIVLDAHNDERARLGLKPLAWNDELAEAAAGYARQVARSGVFKHSEKLAQLRQGENLFMGTRGGFSYAEMIRLWADEKEVFVNNPTPAFSTTGKFGDAAHYTQMIWSTTTSVGCAVASNAENDYLVCRYSPPGNLVGTRAIPLPGDKPGKPTNWKPRVCTQ